MKPILELQDLHVTFTTQEHRIYAVRGVDLTLLPGEIVALVGESGCGKSATVKAILQLLPPATSSLQGSILYKEENLALYSEKQMQKIRGSKISMIFQDPMSSLNPTLRISEQLIEGYLRHHPHTKKKEALARALEFLQLLGIRNPEEKLHAYPHTLSGGMRQRIMIGIALMEHPDILLADEPTTALDATIQAQILHLMHTIQKKMGMSILLITHDLKVAAEFCDRIYVMYGGKIVESATIQELFTSPKHPYTQALLRASPLLDQAKNSPLIPIPGAPPQLYHPPEGCVFAPRCPHATAQCKSKEPPLSSKQDSPSHLKACFYEMENLPLQPPSSNMNIPSSSSHKLVEVKHLSKYFQNSLYDKHPIPALSDISFDIFQGETLGLVGESGCGKSTLGKCLLRLEAASLGDVVFDGQNISLLQGKQLHHFRQRAQIIFQDPYASLDPRMTTFDLIAEPLLIHKKEEIATQVTHLLDLVSLPHTAQHRFPHEFSGGQRQRIGIARALALKPQFIVCDEPISALDVSIQAQIITLLQDLRKELQLTLLFITHDLAMVRYLCDRVAVMYLGHLVELTTAEKLYTHPLHPYTQALLAAIPTGRSSKKQQVEQTLLSSEIPKITEAVTGCPFASRCPHVMEQCHREKPLLHYQEKEHGVACHLYTK